MADIPSLAGDEGNRCLLTAMEVRGAQPDLHGPRLHGASAQTLQVGEIHCQAEAHGSGLETIPSTNQLPGSSALPQPDRTVQSNSREDVERRVVGEYRQVE